MAVFRRADQYRTWYKDVSKTKIFTATDAPDTFGANFILGKTGYTIFVQRIEVQVVTAAAQVITFQDDAGTPVVLAKLPASAAVGDRHLLLESREGVALTADKNLDITGVAGVAGTIVIEAYLKQTAALKIDDVAAAG